MRSIYTEEQIQKLQNNPNVVKASSSILVLKLEFRQRMYDAWLESPSSATIRKFMVDNGFDLSILSKSFCSHLNATFQTSGRPDKEFGSKTRPGEISFSASDYEEMFRAYPKQSVQEYIRQKGYEITPAVTNQISGIELQFSYCSALHTSPAQTRWSDVRLTDSQLDGLRRNPYVNAVKWGTVYLKDFFYQDSAFLKAFPIDRILDTFLIDHTLLTANDKMKIHSKLVLTVIEPLDTDSFGKTMTDACILKRRADALQELAAQGFDRIGTAVPGMTPGEKKQLCIWISRQITNPYNEFTTAEILRRVGIIKSGYYRYIREPGYGNGNKKKERDAAAYGLIRIAFDYKGFRKGARQVYMLIPKLTGKRVSLRKVQEIMKSRGMNAGIRKKNPYRQGARARRESGVKPDLLRRKFRLHRPNEVRVTDVTYIYYGNGKRAYGSALMDPVTSRLIVFHVSENNDLDLAMETLRRGDSHPCIDGGIFHSDQGILYQVEDFQKEVLARGFQQSMSKRGNCWDNATQESFFGHFKDECDYNGCSDIEELKKKIEDYSYYYNNERGLWDRGRMTPVEYETYLSSMDDEAFKVYLVAEEEKYNEMKRRAAELARKRYGTLGVQEDPDNG